MSLEQGKEKRKIFFKDSKKRGVRISIDEKC
jgi:hypothetical protein